MNGKNAKWITQKQASEISGKTLNAIHQLTRNGRFRVKELFGKKLVHSEDVKNFKPIKIGRPTKHQNNHDAMHNV